MPYNAFDSDDDLIVLEIPTDEEEDESDDDSVGSFPEYAELLGKRKRKIPMTQKQTSSKKQVVTQKKSPNNRRNTKEKSKEKATTSHNKDPIVKVEIEENDGLEVIDEIEDNKAEVATAIQSYTTMTDAEVNAIIQTDLSMGADLVTEEYVDDADCVLEEGETVEEKVFTELPNKYLLYDDLIATIIGFDGETPIVEFSSVERDELKQYENNLPVECGICPSILNGTHLNEHLKVHQDPVTKRYNCIYCDNTACNRHSAASHSRRHLGIRPYACDICDNYFTTKNDLKLHYQRKHQEREFICEMCGKAYAQNTFLKRHIESHHQDKRPHQCDYCPKSYHRRGNLKEHIEAVHMGNRKPLSCRFCGIEFRDSHKLSRHRKEEHLNKSHFECTPCGVEFTDIQFFNAHKRSIQCKNNRLALKMETYETNPKSEEVEEELVLS